MSRIRWHINFIRRHGWRMSLKALPLMYLLVFAIGLHLKSERLTRWAYSKLQVLDFERWWGTS